MATIAIMVGGAILNAATFIGTGKGLPPSNNWLPQPRSLKMS